MIGSLADRQATESWTLDDRAVIESERKQIVKGLQESFGQFRLAALSEAVDEIESLIQQHCGQRIRELLVAVSNLRVVPASSYLLGPGDEYFELVVTNDPRKTGVLLVTVLARSPYESQPLTKRVRRISGYGRYDKVEVLLPRCITEHATLIVESVVAICESGYAWIRERIEELVASEEVALGARLYRYARTIFPSRKINENLWFAVVSEQWGFRLIDGTVVDRAFDLMKPQALEYGHSTTKLVAELLQTRLPREKLLMQQALTLGQCIDVSLADAQYRQEGSIYASVLSALYGSDAFTIFPIRQEGQFSILALFPTGMSLVKERLIEHKDEMCEIASTIGCEVKQAEKLFDRDRRWRDGLRGIYDDVLVLNPSLFGVGVDAKALLRKLDPRRLKEWIEKRSS